MFCGTKFLNNLARYDGHLRRCLHRDLQLMMRIRREERKSREAQAAADDVDAASPGPPSGRKRYVPEQAPPPIQNGACQDHESPEDRPRQDIGFRPANPPNAKLQNEAETNLTPTGTRAYEATRAIVSPPMEPPNLA